MNRPRTCIPASKIENDCYDWWVRHRVKCWNAKKEHADVIFFGDSITHFWSKEDNINYGEGLWDELFAGKSVFNLGFGYDRIQNVLWRINNGELENQYPKLFVLNIGTNNFSVTPNYSGDSPEDVAEGIRFLTGRLHEEFPSSHIAVMAIFPRGNDHNSQVNAADDLLHTLIPGIPNAELIDIREKFWNDKKEADSRFYQPDHVHLNRAGYQIWADAILPVIRKYAGF